MERFQEELGASVWKAETNGEVESLLPVREAIARGFDLAVALVGLAFLLLIFPLVALLIKCDSRGPVFYRCRRVGRNGRIFTMYKFRTMYETSIRLGGSVSPLGDPRVTPLGRFLRRTKINEFPQFLNVLKGDMSIVGPRPEAVDLAAAYPPEALPIFSVRPGLVGPNQILGRNEEEFYPRGVDPVDYYIQKILPKKLPMDLKYVQKKSFRMDVKYLFLGAWATLSGTITRNNLADNLNQIVMMIVDSAIAVLSFYLAYIIRFGTIYHHDSNLAVIYVLIIMTFIPFMFMWKCYDAVIKYLCVQDIKNILYAIVCANASLIISVYMLGIDLGNYGRASFVSFYTILNVLIVGYRMALRQMHRASHKGSMDDASVARTIIWGAGEEGYWCLRFLRENKTPCYNVIGFIDEDRRLHNRRINGVKVLGDCHHLEALIQLHKVEQVYVAKSVASSAELSHAQKLCAKLGIVTMCFYPRMAAEIGEGRMETDLHTSGQSYAR
ncbi:MAG: sugar transferase [Syntrophobacteraceae bacterium]